MPVLAQYCGQPGTGLSHRVNRPPRGSVTGHGVNVLWRHGYRQEWPQRLDAVRRVDHNGIEVVADGQGLEMVV